MLLGDGMNEYKKKIEFPYYIGKIPFVYTTNETPNNANGIPNFHDFSIDFNPETGVMTQVENELTGKYLNSAYIEGSQITGYMDDYDLGKMYSKDFLDFIIKNEKEICGKTILEIGCGTGYLLKCLKKLGANVTGIEPGKDNHNTSYESEVKIITDFFPSDKIKEKFDIILFYNVLEHVFDLDEFLINVKKQLNSNGRVYFAVPDCERAIEVGDISMFFHEHFHYFTEKTLKNSFYKTIKIVPIVEKSLFSSELNGTFTLTEDFFDYEMGLNEIGEKNIGFLTKLFNLMDSFKAFFEQCNLKNETIGIYVPSRMINIMALNIELIQNIKLFLYDDDEKLYGKYYPGFNFPIMNRHDLIIESPKYLLIMSYSFSQKIYMNLPNEIHKSSNILFLDDFLEGGRYEYTFNRR